VTGSKEPGQTALRTAYSCHLTAEGPPPPTMS
jgi:hypothetical protein